MLAPPLNYWGGGCPHPLSTPMGVLDQSQGLDTRSGLDTILNAPVAAKNI